MKKLVFLCLIISSFKANATSLLEDFIDFMSGVPSGGYYLKVRELDEAEFALALEREFALDLKAINDEALKARINMEKSGLIRDTSQLEKVNQIIEKVNQAVDLAENMQDALQERMSGQMELGADLQALINSLDAQENNLSLLGQLYEKGLNIQYPNLLVFSERILDLNEKLRLDVSELSKLAVSFEDKDKIQEIYEMFSNQKYRLISFRIQQQSLQERLTRRIDRRKKTLEEL